MLNKWRIGVAVGALTAIGLSAGARADEPYIPLLSKGFQHQFWQAVKKGAEEQAKVDNVRITFEGPESESQVDKQIDMLSADLAKHPNAIGFAALDSKAAIPLLRKAQAEHIPVIAFDSGVDSEIPLTTCRTDSVAAAGEAAKKMAEMIGNTGEVGVIVHDQTSRTGIDRRDGFLAEMKNHPNIKIIGVQYGAGDHLKSAEIAKAMIEAHPNLKGIFGANEGSAEGAAIGVKESGKKGLVLIGFDSGKEQKDAIMSGLMAGAITQNPVGIGKCVVDSAVKALKGEKLPTVIDTGFYWYDKTNMDDPKIAPLLYN